jgi:hypothetical protein
MKGRLVGLGSNPVILNVQVHAYMCTIVLFLLAMKLLYTYTGSIWCKRGVI